MTRTGARGKQACPSPAEPAPSSSPLPSTKGPWTSQATTPPVLARHQDERRLRGKCVMIISTPLRPHLPLGGLADDQPEQTHRIPQTPQRSTHKAPPTRTLPEAINTPPGRRCSPCGNQHFFSHNSAESRLILPPQRPPQESRRPHPPQPRPQLPSPLRRCIPPLDV